jgi:hypothetical protein
VRGEGPGEGDWLLRERVDVRVVSELEVEVLFVQVAKRKYIMPPRRERQSPYREDRDVRRRGRPAGNPEMERQI